MAAKPAAKATATKKAPAPAPSPTPTQSASGWQSGSWNGAQVNPSPTPTATKGPTGPQGKSNTNVGQTGPTGATGQIDTSSLLAPPKSTNLTDYNITSQQDVASLVNSVMQQFVGRNATAAEIATYGGELLAAERANPTIENETLNRDKITGLATSLTGGTTSTGVNAQSFLENLISQTGQAKDFKVATGYMDAMQQSNSKFKGAYNG